MWSLERYALPIVYPTNLTNTADGTWGIYSTRYMWPGGLGQMRKNEHHINSQFSDKHWGGSPVEVTNKSALNLHPSFPQAQGSFRSQFSDSAVRVLSRDHK